MFRSKSLLMILIVCMLSIFSVQHMSLAHPDETAIKKAKEALEKSEEAMDDAVDRWGTIRGDLETLIDAWNKNKAAIKRGNDAALSGTAAAIVSGAAAAAAAVASGGSLAPAVIPAAYSAYVALQGSVAPDSIGMQELMDAMSIVLSLVDAALADVQAAWSGGTMVVPLLNTDHEIVRDADNNIVFRARTLTGYTVQYRAYLEACARHIGMDYNSLFETVQMNSGEVDSHEFEEPKSYHHYSEEPVAKGTYDWETWDLPKDFECYGPCEDMFRSPHEAFTAHQEKCGTAKKHYIDEYMDIPVSERLTGTTSAQDLLAKRSVAQGCGKTWYNCPKKPNPKEGAKHEVRTCKKTVWEKPAYPSAEPTGYTCNRKFRRCMGRIFDHDHNLVGGTTHSDEANSSSTTTQQTIAPDPTPTPSPTPTMHPCGMHATSVSGDHSQISPPCGDPSHANIVLYACQTGSTHATQITGYSGTFYECQPHQTFACGHTDLMSNSYTHRSETCPLDSNGQACSSGSYYACQSHTHVYPAPSATCANGHTYDPSNSTENNRHRTRTCRWCSQTWQRCTSGAPTCLVKTSRSCWAIE